MVNDNITIRNAVIINRNFEGRAEKPYNPQGKRNFSVVLDEETANILLNDGWNVKIRESSDPDEPAKGYLSVSVQFDSKVPPRIIQITKRGDRIKKTPINEDSAALIDSAEIKDVKLEIRPYNWEIKNKDGSVDTGVRAYLKTMYYELVEDPFAADYDDPDFAEMPFDME